MRLPVTLQTSRAHGSTSHDPSGCSVKRAVAISPSRVRGSVYFPRLATPMPEMKLPRLQKTHVPLTCS